MGQTRMQKVRYDGLPPLTTAKIQLSNWPDGSTVALSAGSNDMRGHITVHTGGSGGGASPTLTLTFNEAWVYQGSLSVGPFVLVEREGAGNGPSIVATTTGFVLTQSGAIAFNSDFMYNYMVVG